MKYRIERLTLGGILDQAFRLIRNHFWPMVGGFAALYVPLKLVTEGTKRAAAGEPFAVGQLLVGVPVVLAVVLAAPLAQLVATTTILDAYLGRPITFSSAFARARALYWTYAGTCMLVGLGVLGSLLLLVIPAIYFSICWLLVGPVLVMEGLSGSAAMKRSRSLVRGYFWRTARAMFLASVFAGVLGAAFGILFHFIPVLGAVLGGLVEAIGAAFSSAVLVVLYVDLRCRHENFDVQLLAEQVAQHDSERPRAPVRSSAPVA